MAELMVYGVGVATADPELRQVGNNGAMLCTVTLAFNRSWKDKNDKWQQEPCFVRTQLWGARGEKMAELVKKGYPVYIAGGLKQDSWTDSDDQKRTSFSITIRDFQLCEKNGKKKNEQKPATDKASPPTEATATVDDDDLPF